MTEKKLGRPTDNPKNTKLTVRVDAETLEILEKYCKKENISKMEGIRSVIRLTVRNTISFFICPIF